jgi:hypothetical protein
VIVLRPVLSLVPPPPPSALVPIPEPSSALVERPIETRMPAWIVPSVALAGTSAIALFLAGLPVLSMVMVALTFLGAVVLPLPSMLRPSQHRDILAPELVASPEVRTVYRSILAALDEIDGALARAPKLKSSVGPVIERCHAVVAMSGRLAWLANPLNNYLVTHDRTVADSDLVRLRTRTEAAGDDVIASALGNAAAARARQLATHDEIATMHYRVLARLELVLAALESFAALVVKLQFVEEEQVALAGGSVAEQLAGVGEELGVLESALDSDLAP